MRTAKLVCTILHPWVVLAPIVAIAAYKAANQASEWVKWTLLTLVAAYAFPFVYAWLKAAALRRKENISADTRSLLRERPRELLIATCLFGIPPILLVHFLDGPDTILAIIIAVTAVMLVIALFNLIYRASFHVALVTSILTSLWSLVGMVALVTLPLLPLLGFARWRIGAHTPAQMAVGFTLGLMVTLAVFQGLGLALGVG